MVERGPLEALVIDFLNTLDVDEGTDVLLDRAGWEAWAGERGLVADPVELARDCRDALRDRALCGSTTRRLPAVPLRVDLGADGKLRLVPTGDENTAIAAVLAAALQLDHEGRLDRVKICPADDCRWAFYDRSRNSSRQWCSMAVCGNRAKTRAFRAKS